MTVEEDLYDLLVVEVKTYKQSGKVTLTQVGLNNKVLNTVEIFDINKKIHPAATIIFGTDSGGPQFDEPC